MTTSVLTEKAYRASVDASTHEIAAELQNALGQKLAAYILGVRTQTFGDWASGRVNPRGANHDALRHVAHIYNVLAEADDKHTIRAWMIGMNPMLGDDSPADLLAAGEFKAVLTAARSFATSS